ncbi:hypothetical protein L0U85_07080 [Glycomyces sp. L485]|uniref:hypothetical protein n=1 Tax=Glycomyces sp. L485 TaxID=2909235 RepID=UPI001F4B6EBE|nr:hypothetical protein [Glycomyces sp. L485]MCH7230615.1 hypothetical protein [Glycomyces sp. L485]
MNDQTRTTDRARRRSSFGPAIAVPAVAKAVCGALLAFFAVAVWQQLADLRERQELSEDWADIQDYAVFYPFAMGNDSDEMQSGGNATSIAQARDLYPVLEADGALYVDAINYETGVPDDPSSPWPVPPIRVNSNYIEQYPVMDESGSPIDVGRDEQAWVVAVPEQYKPHEAQLREFVQAARAGGPGLTGAVQAEERIVGEPAPEQFTDQEVRIIWTASGQEVFSFNSNVNPEGGNTITDPVIEIMTPANSLTVDRLNAITGEINAPLKVRVDGDPAAALGELTPLLRELRLDDNLQHLVTGEEAMAREVSDIRSGVAWVSAFAAGALLVMLVLSATLVFITSDRLRRRITVRRLHGVGFTRAYRELLVVLGVTWLVQALLAGAVLAFYEVSSSGTMPGDEARPFAQTPELLAVLAASLVVEVLFVVVTASIVERRNAVKRLKEM